MYMYRNWRLSRFRHLTELKAQIDEDDRRIKMLTEQEVRLNEQITALIGQNNDLIGQVRTAVFFRVNFEFL